MTIEKFNVHIKFNQLVDKKVKDKHAFFVAGGGTKGVYSFGVFKYLFGENPFVKLKDVNIFGGTSVGSFFTIGLSLGYNESDMEQISKKIDLQKLVDSKYKFIETGCRFLAYGYLYDDKGKKDIISTILNHGIDRICKDLEKNIKGEDLTFFDLKELINKKPNIYKHFILNVVDISRDEQLFMTTLDDKFDKVKLFDALVAGSGIPFIFKYSTLYYYPDGSYGYENVPGAVESYLIDGGIATNNPLDYFLLNYDKFKDYDMWLVKFDDHPKYTKIDGSISMLHQITDYVITGKTDLHIRLLQKLYDINVIDLKLKTAGTLEIYTQKEIQEIILDIYDQFVSDKVIFS